MSESLDNTLKQWCTEAHTLVGKPLDSASGSVKDKWSELEKVISANVDESKLGPEGWKRQKKLIEDAIANRELNPSDLSLDGDPIQKAINLGTKIVDVREIAKRGEAVGIKRAGLRTLVSSPTGKTDLAELEKISASWKQTKDLVGKFVESGFKVAEDPVYQTAVEKAPTEKDFLAAMATADVSGARSLADEYASWWPQTKAALEKVRKLKNDYSGPTGAIPPDSWYDLATTSNNIDRLEKEIADQLKKAENALATGKATASKGEVESAQRALKRLHDEWTKVKVDDFYAKEEAGTKTVSELTELLISAQSLAVEEPPLSDDPLYETLTTHMGGRYDYFASLSDKWDRLGNRGVDCAPAVSTFLRDNFRLGMGIRVGSRVFTVCPSNTSSAGLAFHTPIPAKLLIPERPNVQSFVYHF